MKYVAKNKQGGFLKLIILIVIAVLLLRYFGITGTEAIDWVKSLSITRILDWIKELLNSVG
ncbi:hypothetical protein A3A05_01540 [Candidatus Nomurabacteria bacterium RIFCSPLOWO2_01_FULL_41_12]|uniref:Uncharacterized protein n=1 Tax=Candidatus Nomurabacteria bacterium RIFCSPLOWO2_01_FULL_41_12 TaxID=1801774 RepID=A0A1F6WW43_9BACT|nr:MAG: hypothetical protein A2732_01515 [Candidatus Nomurabacteria bacterium RIFCSPHIGHO2_01_FULL_40_10]OGI86080.1 MAG: hypothetical protein A3A05_01540 [Candidatus Nomurabacteria bacterium RIFCSPLOWO2_01_FULL_41_12]